MVEVFQVAIISHKTASWLNLTVIFSAFLRLFRNFEQTEK